jgi:hypothetical protein
LHGREGKIYRGSRRWPHTRIDWPIDRRP